MKRKHKAAIQNGADENVAENGDHVAMNGDSKPQKNEDVEIIL